MAHVGKKITLGLIGGIGGLLGFAECLLDLLAIGHKPVDLLRDTDEIGFSEEGIFLLKETQGLTQPREQLLVATVLFDQRQIGLGELRGADLEHMVAQLSVMIKLTVGCADLLEKKLHLTGRSISLAKETPDLPCE